jgi:hypothetical protein
MAMQIKSRILVIVWLIVGGYLGSAGWARVELEQEIKVQQGPAGQIVCDGVTFESIETCQHYLRDKQMGALFPWLQQVPPLFGLLLLGFGFGCLGGSMRALAESVQHGEELTLSKAIDLPLFGGLLGVMVLGIVYLVPAALTINESVLRPAALLFLAILGGAFSTRVYTWVEHQVDALFPRRAEQKPKTDPEAKP